MQGAILLARRVPVYFDIKYFIRFLGLLLAFYYFNLLYYGITDPGNTYFPFLDKHLNYISWLSSSILETSRIIDHAFGIRAVIKGYIIGVEGGASVSLNYSCLGFGIMSFWIAFIAADYSSWKKKIYWCLAGVAVIWFINCWRIALLLLALQNRWESNSTIDHHDLFNIAAYSLIFLLMYLYNNAGKKLLLKESSLPAYAIKSSQSVEGVAK